MLQGSDFRAWGPDHKQAQTLKPCMYPDHRMNQKASAVKQTRKTELLMSIDSSLQVCSAGSEPVDGIIDILPEGVLNRLAPGHKAGSAERSIR